ncbi:hypothetical protein [uncultured Victivallis sp.]|uniref:hypothetical protein n=1 Tax=uncultured Victivallis sp. TaxID=354118 RepID=UPI00259432E4|nr:hypothetical protein [uncultured Victivallis sp.]
MIRWEIIIPAASACRAASSVASIAASRSGVAGSIRHSTCSSKLFRSVTGCPTYSGMNPCRLPLKQSSLRPA